MRPGLCYDRVGLAFEGETGPARSADRARRDSAPGVDPGDREGSSTAALIWKLRHKSQNTKNLCTHAWCLQAGLRRRLMCHKFSIYKMLCHQPSCKCCCRTSPPGETR